MLSLEKDYSTIKLMLRAKELGYTIYSYVNPEEVWSTAEEYWKLKNRYSATKDDLVYEDINIKDFVKQIEREDKLNKLGI